LLPLRRQLQIRLRPLLLPDHVSSNIIWVDDPADPRIAAFVGLRDRELRVVDGQFVAESDILIDRAVLAGFRPLAVMIDATRTEPLPAVLADDVPVYGASPELLRRITGLAVHRGSLGLFERRPQMSVIDVLHGARRLVVLGGVMNPTNLGVIFRTAAAFGFDGILLDVDSTDPLYRRASRVSMGTVYGFPHATIPRLPEGLNVLRNAGFVTLALTPDDDAESLDNVTFARTDKIAILLGTEGPGLSNDAMASADRLVRIPISSGVDSLNVSAAAAVALYALTRQSLSG
jgi:tRNA G18 (ribose-2'-O)-methylase SpoU